MSGISGSVEFLLEDSPEPFLHWLVSGVAVGLFLSGLKESDEGRSKLLGEGVEQVLELVAGVYEHVWHVLSCCLCL